MIISMTVLSKIEYREWHQSRCYCGRISLRRQIKTLPRSRISSLRRLEKEREFEGWFFLDNERSPLVLVLPLAWKILVVPRRSSSDLLVRWVHEGLSRWRICHRDCPAIDITRWDRHRQVHLSIDFYTSRRVIRTLSTCYLHSCII